MKPELLVVYFHGEVPCNKNVQLIQGIFNSIQKRALTSTIHIDLLFSSKARGGYPNYYEKIKIYVTIISSLAVSIDKNVSAKSFKVALDSDHESVFHYSDTNSSWVGIRNVSDKLLDQKVGIIGIGDTGSYILD